MKTDYVQKRNNKTQKQLFKNVKYNKVLVCEEKVSIW